MNGGFYSRNVVLLNLFIIVIMKRLFVIIFLAAAFIAASCQKDDKSGNSSPDIIYSAEVSESTGDMFIKGSYTDNAGKIVALNEKLPWRKELKGVPSGLEYSFKGYLFSVSTNRVLGRISMTVTGNNTSKPLYNVRKNIDISTNAVSFTADELKKETSFDFFYR